LLNEVHFKKADFNQTIRKISTSGIVSRNILTNFYGSWMLLNYYYFWWPFTKKNGYWEIKINQKKNYK
jgi:hypothetical protein